MSPPSPPTHILETCLYVRDIAQSVSFYKDILNLAPFLDNTRMAAFALGHTTLLLFQLGLTAADSHPTDNDCIPGHGPSDNVIAHVKDGKGGLKQHYCLAVTSTEEVEEWERHFEKEGVTTLGTMDWQKGGRSAFISQIQMAMSARLEVVGSGRIIKLYLFTAITTKCLEKKSSG